jgi:PTS system nitrogen regulatory IIA component
VLFFFAGFTVDAQWPEVYTRSFIFFRSSAVDMRLADPVCNRRLSRGMPMANDVLKSGLDIACIKLELNASGRDEAIRELVGLVHAKHRLRNVEDVVNVVMVREQKMCTSLENGIAVPHGKSDSIDRLLVAVGLKPKGIDFKSSDGQPAKIIILILSAASQSGAHVRCLAEIGRLLQSDANRQKILAAKDAETVFKIMTDTAF